VRGFSASPLAEGERIKVRGFAAALRQVIWRKTLTLPSLCKGEVAQAVSATSIYAKLITRQRHERRNAASPVQSLKR
jgi:hypothetical protein